jgi:quercetin dioxygenase-like cupin family protein
MKSRGMIAVVAAVPGLAGILVGPAAATPPEGEIVRTALAKGTTEAPVSIVTQGEETTFYIDNVLLKPAASSGWHAHPGPEYTVVTKGTVHLQTATRCPATTFSGGQAVFIPGGMPHVVFNQGTDEANAVVTYTLPAGLAVRVDAPDACP